MVSCIYVSPCIGVVFSPRQLSQLYISLVLRLCICLTLTLTVDSNFKTRKGGHIFISQVNIDECESSPCQNGGSCEDGVNMFTCNCDNTGFTGTTCGIDIDECLVSRSIWCLKNLIDLIFPPVGTLSTQLDL